MIARSVNAAADVIHRAQVNGTQTATGIAIALESARLLQSPESVHASAELEAERDRLKARVVELEEQLVALQAQQEVLREVPDGEHAAWVRHSYRTPHDLDLPGTGGAPC